MERKEGDFIRWFSELSNKDIAIAGGKGASLAEMYNHKFPIPPGFMVTAQAYSYFIEKTGLATQIKALLTKLNIEDTAVLTKTSERLREMIDNARMPDDLEEAILEAYDVLDVNRTTMGHATGSALDILRNSHEPPFVAVRSSATTEDLADASFAGQQDSFLSIKGHESLIVHIKKCFSSLFTARAIYYRQKKGFSHETSQLAVVIQKMIDSQKSGVMFSQNPLKNDDTIIIEAVWGLGEGIVSGRIAPDNYVLSRNLDIKEQVVVDKKVAIVRVSSGKIEEVKLNAERSNQQVLTGHELKRLGQYALELEEHYGKPQDIEFAIAGEIYIVQSRPITTKARESHGEVNGNVLLSGLGASPGVSSGIVRIVRSPDDLAKIQKGDVLVTMMTNPDMVVAMQKASGIVTDEGGITSHAAIVSREMGIPAVVGTRSATQVLKDGQVITVDGSTGRVIEGRAEEKRVEIKPIVATRTKIKVIVDLPDYAARAALTGSRAVGLVRLEGIIAISGKHPRWYILNNTIKEYIASLSSGLKKIALHFDEIWIRTSDIRTDEYEHLLGAPKEKESNPMLGNHGIRFSLKNIDLLEAECEAIKEIADEFPNKTFGIMMPQVISVEEVTATKKIIEHLKLPSNVTFGVMIETPAAVQLIEELCDAGISFISFGTNDLTQYTLALDRNNSEVQDLYNELHPAVLRSIKRVIEVCKTRGVETSICGQAGSKPEMVTFLIKEGITSISVNADAAFSVSHLVASIEQKIGISASEGREHPYEKITPHILPAPVIETVREEDIILQALGSEDRGEDYVPRLGVSSDIPTLNDAIPVESRDFELQQDEVSKAF